MERFVCSWQQARLVVPFPSPQGRDASIVDCEVLHVDREVLLLPEIARLLCPVSDAGAGPRGPRLPQSSALPSPSARGRQDRNPMPRRVYFSRSLADACSSSPLCSISFVALVESFSSSFFPMHSTRSVPLILKTLSSSQNQKASATLPEHTFISSIIYHLGFFLI